MKEKEAKIDYREHQLVLYVEKKDGSYGPVQTGSYITKHYIDDYWYKRKNLEKEYQEKIRRGEISPIAYYMILEELTPSELASRVGIPTRKVKRHLRPEHFGTITVDQLDRYCAVFNVSYFSLFHALTSRKSDVRLKEDKTDNPYYTILSIEVGKK